LGRGRHCALSAAARARMKKTNALYLGNEPSWSLQTKQHEQGRQAADWAQLETNKGRPAPNPHVRTFGHTAEKWDHSGRSFVESRPLVLRAPPMPPSRTWGIEGDIPSGKAHIVPHPAEEARISSKRIVGPKPSGVYNLENEMARKAHVFDASGTEVRCVRSTEFALEDTMVRKKKVTEEVRTAHRTIDRVAPAGLKGFIGVEYSNGYYAQDGVIVRQRLRPSKADLEVMELEAAMARSAQLGITKSFAEKKREAELEGERELVCSLEMPYESLSGDESPCATGE